MTGLNQNPKVSESLRQRNRLHTHHRAGLGHAGLVHPPDVADRPAQVALGQGPNWRDPGAPVRSLATGQSDLPPPAQCHPVGGSTFKTEVPANVTQGIGFIRYIKSFQQPVFSETVVNAMLQALQTGRRAPTLATHREHMQNLNRRSDPAAGRHCPKCGNDLLILGLFGVSQVSSDAESIVDC